MARICRVLVVEDNDDIQELLRATLVSEGYRFARARDGAQMRRILAEQRVDVCVIDVRLAGSEDGLSLAQAAAEEGYGVILVSADLLLMESLEKSGHRFLAKPFRLSSLLHLVDEVLRETRAECRVRRGAAAAAPGEA
jgi:DNA-binding NtrC family response regulator